MHNDAQKSNGPVGSLLFQRWEVKYVVDRTTRTGLERDLAALMRPDAFGFNNGTYVVRSLYFDTPDFLAFHSKNSGEAVRHKLRARIYTDDAKQADWVRLEVKSRILAIIHKVTCGVSRATYEEIWQALQHRALPRPEILAGNPGLREFFRLQKLYNMEPKVIVQYRRKAWERRDISRIRANFDDEIVASRHTDLLGELRNLRRLLQYGHSVFEIKVDGVMPYWLHMLIDKYNLQARPFSKFCYSLLSEARTSAAISRDD